jgi:predicted nucleic acid-binding protein
MTRYFDTSYLFRLYSTEPGFREVQACAGEAETIVSAWHARAEFAAVLHRKKREQAWPDADLAESRLQFADDLSSKAVVLLPLDEAVISRLETVFRNAPAAAFLRAADALHLACAAENGFTEVYSNDRHFLAAAPLFGLRGVNILSLS